MQTVYDPNLKANLTIDDQKNVRSINHFQDYWRSEKQNPIEIATDYFNQIADLIKVSKESLKNMYQNVSYTEPKEQEIEYRLSEEKQYFDSITFGFYQTFLNVPVWQAGLTVTLKSSPYRIISAVNTSQQGIDAELPIKEKIEQHKKMFNQASIENYIHNLNIKDKEKPSTSEFIRKLIDTNKLQEELSDSVGADNKKIDDNARLIRGRFFVYRYDEKNRLPIQKPTEPISDEENYDRNSFESEYEPTLPLLPVDQSIKDGQYYLVSEITFSFATIRYGSINWFLW